MKKYLSMLLVLVLVLSLLTGCGNDGDTDTTQTDTEMFTDRDRETDYDESKAVTIRLNGTSAAASSDSVTINGSTVTITEEATYVISGSLKDGMLVVNAPDTAKLQLVFSGVDITSETSAALYILEADKVFVTLADGTENTLANGGSFVAIDDNNIDTALFSKQDLTLNGSGSLTVTSPVGHGIVCKDDLVFTGGTYVVNSAFHGLDANDSVRIADAGLTIDAGKDAIHCENTDDTAKGFIYIESGCINVEAEGDGIAAGNLLINGGSFSIASADDSIHSDTSITIGGGTFVLVSGDDAIHAEEELTVTDGDIDIRESYEGLEALDIVIKGGNIKLAASDDGLNAAGGTDSSGTIGGRDGMFSGGYTVVVGPAQGDTATLDYDKSAVITGGTFIGTGASGMAQTFSDSEQGVVAVRVGNQSAGTEITLKDKNGNTVIKYTPDLSFAVVILSSPDIVSGEIYSITVGSQSGEFEAN